MDCRRHLTCPGVGIAFGIVKRGLNRAFATDLRSLAALRVALGLLLLTDMITRAADIEAFYSDAGVLPRATALGEVDPWVVSLLFVSGKTEIVASCFLLGAAAGIAIAIGFKTRLATFVGWLVLISIQSRNPMILHNGDVLLRLLMFWAMFVPIGARASLDALAVRRTRLLTPKGQEFFSVGCMALMAQVAIVYMHAVLKKTGVEWWPEGTAVHYALQYDMLTRDLAYWLREYRPLTHVLTYVTYFMEAVVPLLLFTSSQLRLVAILLLAGMHLGFGLCLELGNFPWVDAAALLLFVLAAPVIGVICCKTPGQSGARSTESTDADSANATAGAKSAAAKLSDFLTKNGVPFERVEPTAAELQVHFNNADDLDSFLQVAVANPTVFGASGTEIAFNDATNDASEPGRDTRDGFALADNGKGSTYNPVKPYVGGQDYSAEVQKRLQYWEQNGYGGGSRPQLNSDPNSYPGGKRPQLNSDPNSYPGGKRPQLNSDPNSYPGGKRPQLNSDPNSYPGGKTAAAE